MEDMSSFSHLLTQGGVVGVFTFFILFVMSVLSWVVIFRKWIELRTTRARTAAFVEKFPASTDIRQLDELVDSQTEPEPFSNVVRLAIESRTRHLRIHGSENRPALADAIERAVRRGIQREISRAERGLTVLASIGSTAPFVGLFGTVWGIFKALIAIGATGAASLDAIAGPVGEALIMTATGLGVAIPAVIGYNVFVRSNRNLAARLEDFAHELYLVLTATPGEAQVAHPGMKLKQAGVA
jgi:biopolymer transport protein ExbB